MNETLRTFHFKSAFQTIGSLPLFGTDVLKNEPMFFSASPEFAYENGGPITKAFLDQALPHAEGPCVLDSRLHMLMPGWYPCIPGWHHDDVPRTRIDKQPNYVNPEYLSQHVIGLVNSDIAPTHYGIGEIDLPEVPLGETVYEKWHPMIDRSLETGSLELQKHNGNDIILMDYQTIHRGCVAVKNGWRWFGRLSFNTNRVLSNEKRNQVQIYMESTNAGW